MVEKKVGSLVDWTGGQTVGWKADRTVEKMDEKLADAMAGMKAGNLVDAMVD